MRRSRGVRERHTQDGYPGYSACHPYRGSRGQTGIEYLALLGVVVLLIGGISVAALSRAENEGLRYAACRAMNPWGGAESCAKVDVSDDKDGKDGKDGDGDGKDDDGGGGDGKGDDPIVPVDDPFQPAKCLLSVDQTKTTVVVQILFIKISSSEQIKVSQWSDGTVTLERVTETGGGVTASISAEIPGLKDWGGSASLSGSYMKSSGSGGQWLFNGNKSGDAQADLEANLEDAKQFAEFLKAAEKCQSRPAGARSAELGMICGHQAQKKRPDIDPEKAPDVDITKASTELSGGVSFGKSFAKDDKAVKALKDNIAKEVTKNNPKVKGEALEKLIKESQSKSVIGSAKDTKEVGNVSADGLAGAMSNDVVVMRTKTGPDAGKITFIYTFSLNGTVGAVAQAKGSRMQQIAITYDAAAYDQEEKDDQPHHPEKLVITSSQESGDGPGVQVGGGANAGPVTIDVGGGGGTIKSQVHTESAEVKLDNDADSQAVEDWLRGRGDNPAGKSIPSPTSAAEPLTDDAGPIDRLLHDKGKLTRLDYEANTDWWNASLGIGFGVSAGQFTLGFKLFGIDITHEERNQKITGNPTYATGPQSGGGRPWVPFTNCTKTTPIDS
ncbi:hypothetical protein ACIBJC_32265 [Streptomyces sp. NPDC050509]|uniref:hypothetical protein n=1 Tax=Streptomyces sp. NPDC050509 TaxID=3365620 RepID=UPI0037971A34